MSENDKQFAGGEADRWIGLAYPLDLTLTEARQQPTMSPLFIVQEAKPRPVIDYSQVNENHEWQMRGTYMEQLPT